MLYQGVLTKMETEFNKPIQYYLVFKKDYIAIAAALKKHGFNAELFDLQVSRVSVPKCPESDEAKIQAVIDNKAINKSSSLFKVRVQVAQ